MARALFVKEGNAIWMSHLDLMRLFQRAFKRAGLPLKHTQGFSPRAMVSIALPLSVGVESRCELLDFELEADVCPLEEIPQRLNGALVDGLRVLAVYREERKIRDIALLSCQVDLEYDGGVPAGAQESIACLFSRDSLSVEKRGKNGVQQQDIIPMIRQLEVVTVGANMLQLQALICCQNPALNPAQLASAVNLYLPEYRPDFSKSLRMEIFDATQTIFR